MEEELNFRLVDGRFNVADANLLLMELLRFKIGFHEQKLFSDYNEFNRDNSNSKKRIATLNRTLQEVRRLMADAKGAGMEVEITCMVQVKTLQK